MSSEYRRAKRRQANHSIEVIDTMTDEVIGRIGNLSETGMLMVANRQLANDALYQLRFQLLDGIGTGPIVEIGAHELWSDDAAAPGQVWTGLRFIDLSLKDLQHIREWVEAPGSHYV
jgi:hypothetical protein